MADPATSLFISLPSIPLPVFSFLCPQFPCPFCFMWLGLLVGRGKRRATGKWRPHSCRNPNARPGYPAAVCRTVVSRSGDIDPKQESGGVQRAEVAPT